MQFVSCALYCTDMNLHFLQPKGAFTPDANDANKSRYSHEVGRLNILSLLASFTREIRAWNSLHNRRKFASWEGLLPGSSSLVAKSIPVFVKVRRCIYSSGCPHTTTINLSSIVVWDFLPPLVMTSLLEQVQIFQLYSAAGLSFASLHLLNMQIICAIRVIHVWCERTLRSIHFPFVVKRAFTFVK